MIDLSLKPKKVLICCALFLTYGLSAQIGIGTDTPQESAILDIVPALNDKGVLIPRVNIANLSTQAPITGDITNSESLLVYNTNTTTGKGFYYWTGTKWEKLTVKGDDVDTSVYKNNGTVADNFRTINLDNHIFGYINNATDNSYLYLSPAGVYSDEFYWSSSTGHGFAVGTDEAFVLDVNRMASLVSNNSPVTPTTGSLVIRHEVTDGTGVSSIVFPSSSNRGSDYGYISYEDDGSTNGTTDENGLLTIGIANDGTGTSDNDRDNLNIVASGSVGVSNKAPNQQAALDLGQTNKGLLINRVALTSTTSKGPIYGNQADMPESLLVYNTATAGAGSNNVVPGFYFWKNNKWNNLRNGDPENIYTTNGTISTDRTLNLNNKTLDFKNGTDDLFSFQSNGSLKLKKYGAAAFLGNPANLLGVTSTGDLIELNANTAYAAANQDWLKENTTSIPTSVDDNIYTHGKVAIGKNSAYGALHLYEATGSTSTFNGGTLTLEHGNAGGESSIVFRSKNNGNSDYAYLRYEEDYDGSDTRSAENGRLTLGIENDVEGNVQDDINIKATGIIDYTVGGTTTSTYTMTTNAFYPQSNRLKDLGLNTNRWRNLYIDRLYYRQLTQDSDRRLKNHIANLGKGLEEVMRMNTYSYNYKDDKAAVEHYGFIAQELNDVLPKLVSSIDDNANETLTVNTTEIIPVLVNAIQEQNKLIENQKSRIDDLEKAIERIEKKLK